eukprot:365475-Chlamydomonas_euryale.AAC.16
MERRSDTSRNVMLGTPPMKELAVTPRTFSFSLNPVSPPLDMPRTATVAPVPLACAASGARRRAERTTWRSMLQRIV